MTTYEAPPNPDRSPASRRRRLSCRASVPIAALFIGVCVVAVGVVGYVALNALTPAGTPGHTTTTTHETCSNPPSGARCTAPSAVASGPTQGRAA